MEPLEGSVSYSINGKAQDRDQILKKIALVGPYIGLPEELSLKELIDFQLKMIPECGSEAGYQEMVELFGMEAEQEKSISQYSTGMKQKARIILSLTKNRPIWLLDEPTSNLDPESHQHFWNLLLKEKENRIILVASNDPTEFTHATRILDLN